MNQTPHPQPALSPELQRFAQIGKTAGGFLHDMVNHVGAVTLSLGYFEARAAEESRRLEQYAHASANMRRSIEDFAASIRAYFKDGSTRCFFSPILEAERLAALFFWHSHTRGVHVNIVGDQRIRLYGNRLKFCQLISNLLSNALDASTHGGHVTILCEKQAPFVKISIIDTGCGMSTEARRHLFTPFTSTKQDRGTGLGLVTVKHIIEEDFGGRVEVETKEGVGSTFSLFFRTRIGGPKAARANRGQ